MKVSALSTKNGSPGSKTGEGVGGALANWHEGFAVLERIAEEPGQHSSRTLARETGLSKSAMHRLLQEWTAGGIVTLTPGGGYAPGVNMVRLAARVMDRQPVRMLARPQLVALHGRFNETVHLNIFDWSRYMLVPIDCIVSSHRVRFVIEIGEVLDPSYGATGKAVLAHLPEPVLRSILDRSQLAALTPATITDEARLRADLEEVRRQGYAISFGERTYHVVGIASALRDGHGQVVGELSLCIPKERFDPGATATYGEAMRDAALAVSSSLGYPG